MNNQEEYIKQLEEENAALKKKLERLRQPAPLNIQIVELKEIVDTRMEVDSREFIVNRMLRMLGEGIKQYVEIDTIEHQNNPNEKMYRMRLYLHKRSQEEL